MQYRVKTETKYKNGIVYTRTYYVQWKYKYWPFWFTESDYEGFNIRHDTLDAAVNRLIEFKSHKDIKVEYSYY